MKMSLAKMNGWRLREPPFSLQRTYVTPLKQLSRFVEALLQPFVVERASAHVELFVFEPTELIWYLRGFSIKTNEDELNRATLTAENPTETSDLSGVHARTVG